MKTAQNSQVERAVRALRALCFDEVDRRIADEVRDKEICRVMVDLQRRFILLQNAVVDQADLRGKSHCLHLIVGDIDEGWSRSRHAGAAARSAFRVAALVEVRKRLVHEQRP